MKGKYSLPLLLFTIIATSLASSCSIQDRIENREDRLLGTWVIDNAFFRRDGALFRDNVLNDFRGDRITFLPDGTVEYVTGNGEFFDGPWFIDAIRADATNDDLEFTIDADFFDGFGNLAFRWVGTIDRLGSRNFNVNISERNGVLRLKWDKL